MAVQPPPTWQGPETIEGPAPGVRFAGPGARLAAYIIDGIIMGVVFALVLVVMGAVVVGSVGTSGDRAAGVAVGGILLAFAGFALFNLLYFPWFWSRGGQTPGMRLMAIRVVRDGDGGPVSFGSAVLRLVGYWINNATLYIGFIWIFVDKRRRGWHDLIAGTCVIDVLKP
jgi:uncharacterized RDD family membrane protein YckC